MTGGHGADPMGERSAALVALSTAVVVWWFPAVVRAMVDVWRQSRRLPFDRRDEWTRAMDGFGRGG